MWLANDGNYYEGIREDSVTRLKLNKITGRWFTPWAKVRYVEEYYLERIVGTITGQATVPMGDAILSTYDSCIGAETCEA
jgi:NAD+ synthase (glutamine-hydrolysing)